MVCCVELQAEHSTSRTREVGFPAEAVGQPVSRCCFREHPYMRPSNKPACGMGKGFGIQLCLLGRKRCYPAAADWLSMFS